MGEKPDSFVDLIGSLTNYIQNERVASYNEGVDMMLAAIREWMCGAGLKPTGNTVPDLLFEMREQLAQ